MWACECFLSPSCHIYKFSWLAPWPPSPVQRCLFLSSLVTTILWRALSSMCGNFKLKKSQLNMLYLCVGPPCLREKRHSREEHTHIVLMYQCAHEEHLETGRMDNKTLCFYDTFHMDIYKHIKIIPQTLSSAGLRARIIFVFYQEKPE